MALLQSKEEILEAINADIVSNGKKAITADILNLIFNSIVELMGTGNSGGGASTEQVYTDFSDGTGLTEAQKVANAAIYAKAKAAYEQGSAIPLITIDATLLYSQILGTTNLKFNLLANHVAYLDPNDPTLASGGSVGFMVGVSVEGSNIACIIQEDGSCVANMS